jgi:bifunctional pyridoxal-dependent enzyme with beta-cystathionase and maltose regulon repressor activities
MNKQEWLLTQISQFPELSARQLASYLNDKVLFDNPTPIGQVPIVPTLEEALTIVKDNEVLVIAESPVYDKILDALNQNRPDWIVNNLTTLKRGGKLSQESYDAILVLLQRTDLDPDYQSQILISPAELAGYGVILVSEVEELMNVQI